MAKQQPQDPMFSEVPYQEWQSYFPSSTVGAGSSGPDRHANQNAMRQVELSQRQQQYARGMGPGTRYEQETERRQRQMLDDQRERDQYNLALQRRADGLPPTEEGRQFDSRMNVLRSLFSGSQAPYAAMPNGPQQSQGYAMSMGGNGSSQGFQDPMRPKVNNFLAQLFGGR